VKILFIAWDAAHVKYLQSLFLPVFSGLQKETSYRFHILHFTWADKKKTNALHELCAHENIQYTHVPVRTSLIGKLLSQRLGISIIRSYVTENSIDVIMPRSTIPASMTMAAVKSVRSVKVLFDADGLPIEERVDFAGLKKGGLRYHALKRIERAMVKRADGILTRTEKAIDILISQNPGLSRNKFHVVINGRDEHFFKKADEQVRFNLRQSLGIPADGLVLVYCGSLGPQYGIDQMVYILNAVRKQNPNTFLLLIANNPAGQLDKYDQASLRNVIVREVDPIEVPDYLSVGDVALAIRKSSFSMQGVAPIKLGEYLLVGLPIVASANIGDTSSILSVNNSIYLLEDYRIENLDNAKDWIFFIEKGSHNEIQLQSRALGLKFFSLKAGIESYKKALSFSTRSDH
jgi:glycosyltransferase involved in cell wall biosynthesis